MQIFVELCTYMFSLHFTVCGTWTTGSLFGFWYLSVACWQTVGGFASLGMGSGISTCVFWCLNPSTSICTHHNYIIFDEVQVFKFGTKDGKPANRFIREHTYILQPITGNANYSKLRSREPANRGQPLQKASVNLDDVTLCLPKVHIKPHFPPLLRFFGCHILNGWVLKYVHLCLIKDNLHYWFLCICFCRTAIGIF